MTGEEDPNPLKRENQQIDGGIGVTGEGESGVVSEREELDHGGSLNRGRGEKSEVTEGAL